MKWILITIIATRDIDIQMNTKELLDTNILKPGAISTKYQGVVYTGNLLETGCIQYNEKVFNTPSGFASFVRKKSSNGWTTVWYEGRPLDSYRDKKTKKKLKVFLLK